MLLPFALRSVDIVYTPHWLQQICCICCICYTHSCINYKPLYAWHGQNNEQRATKSEQRTTNTIEIDY